MIWGALVAGLLIGGIAGVLMARRNLNEQLAAKEAEWSKRWRFEEARMAAKVKLAHDERDAIAAERDAEWWKWLQALASGKIPLSQAMKNAPAPRPAGRSGSKRNSSDEPGITIHLDSRSMAPADRAETA